MALDNPAVAFEPSGRTIDFVPQPGVLGAIEVNGNQLNLTKFDPKIRGEPVDVSNFNSPPDPLNGTLFREWIMGAADGEFTISGYADMGNFGWRPMVGDTGFLVLYYSAALHVDCNYLVTETGGPQEATKAGEFTCTVKANGLIDLTGRNNFN
jgi:hypothetical protein